MRAGNRSRGLLTAAAAVVLLAVCVLLTRSLWAPGQDGAARANVLALPVGVLSLVASMVSGWFAWRALQPAPQPRDAARELRDAVRSDRERFLSQALGMRYTVALARLTFADPEPGSLPAQAESLLLNWQDVDGAGAGSLDDVADFYRQEPTGRLVVLGAPGAGKTVLLTRLVLDLTSTLTVPTDGDLPDGFRVPVLLSLSSCDLRGAATQSVERAVSAFNGWVIGQLTANYGLSVPRATELVWRRHVLPVLDGLDEMDSNGGRPAGACPRAAALLDVLNGDRPLPVVLACRELEYGELADADDGRLLVDARHVTVRPLTAEDVVAYLAARFGGRTRTLPSRWEPVAAAVRSDAPLLAVLENPWQLFLAVTAYADETSEPHELLSMSAPEVEDHLLARLVPAVVEQDPTLHARGWTADQVSSWLSGIAVHQQELAVRRDTSPTDLQFPDLWWMSGRRYPRTVPAVVAAMVGAAATVLFARGAVSGGTMGTAVVWWITTALTAISTVGITKSAYGLATPLTRLDLTGLGERSRRRRFWRDLEESALMALGFGVLGVVFVGVINDLVSGIIAGSAFTLLLLGIYQIHALGGELGAASSPSVLAKQCLTYSFVLWLAICLAVAFPISLPIAIHGDPGLAFLFGIPFGLVTGTPFWLGYGNGSMWLRYVLGVRSAARRNLLPRRPVQFLDWCVSVGLMRMAGNTIQFRHSQLQKWLIGQAAHPSAAASPRG